MRKWRIVIVLLLCLVLAGSIACNPFGGDKEEVEQQLVEVVRGDLIVSVSGSGNIEVADEAKLSFGVGGKIEKIYVEEGDNVTGGDVLAKLDTDELELALTQARVTVAQAQVAVTQAQVALTQAQVAVNTANVSLRTAEHSLNEARDLYTWSDIKAAKADVDEAERNLELSLEKLGKYLPVDEDGQYPDILEYVLGEDYPKLPGYKVWQERVIHAQSRLNAAKDRLGAMLSGSDTEEVAIKKMEVAVAEQTLVLRQQSLEYAQQSLEQAQQSLEHAQQSLEYAQKQLDEATLTAPFGGVVAIVYVDEGDVIPSPSMGTKEIFHLIDLTSMELEVEMDEIDVPGVKLGQRVIIEIDALPDIQLEGRVAYISSLAKEEAGVVLYEVTIGFDVPRGSGIKAGMSTDADIVINERSNVLLVPERAIKQDSQGNPVVEVMVDKEAQERPVVTGISDGFETEIVKGLDEGEVVVIEKRAK